MGYTLVALLVGASLRVTIAAEPETTQPSSPPQLERLAVIDFEVIGNVGVEGAGAIIAEGLLARFPDERFDLVERRLVGRILLENDLQMTDIVGGQNVQAHTILGVHWLVYGTVSKPAGFELTARRVGLNANIVRRHRVRASTFEELQDRLAEVANVLSMDDEQYRQWHRDPRAHLATLLARATELLKECNHDDAARAGPRSQELLQSALAVLDEALALDPTHHSARCLKAEVIRRLNALPEQYTNSMGMRMTWTSAGLYMSRCEVTVETFRSFLMDSGYAFPQKEWERIDGTRGTSPGPRYPMCCVTCHEAEAFCRWLSEKEGRAYRLPTCQEWELVACQAKRSRGAMNCMGTGGADRCLESSPVGEFEQTANGICDLFGNVREWCRTRSQDEHCVTMGGSWWDPHRQVRQRKPTGCEQRRNYIGFRIVAPPPLGG